MNNKALNDLLVIAALKCLPDLKRQPLLMGLFAIISVIPIFFIVVLGGNLAYGVIGGLVASFGYLGLMIAIQDMAWDRYVKIREIIVAMPVHPISYALGIALAPLVMSFPAIVVFLGLAMCLNILTIFSLPMAILVLASCWATLSSIGFLISMNLRKASAYTLSNLSNILGVLLIFIPPVYYAEEVLGGLSWLSILIPTSNAAGLIRIYSGLLSASPTMILVRWGVLIGTLALCLVLMVTRSKWREP